MDKSMTAHTQRQQVVQLQPQVRALIQRCDVVDQGGSAQAPPLQTVLTEEIIPRQSNSPDFSPGLAEIKGVRFFVFKDHGRAFPFSISALTLSISAFISSFICSTSARLFLAMSFRCWAWRALTLPFR